jgi:CDP-glycerol glycerophosphotransferase (TagB/SpsB family)
MTVLYHSDVLITDYSSVWMDYLLLKRPIVFYSYDDFVHDDAGVYYDVKDEHVGHFCYTEDELFALLKSIKKNYHAMCPVDDVVSKFHKYVDGNSCERYFNYISKYGANAEGDKVD